MLDWFKRLFGLKKHICKHHFIPLGYMYKEYNTTYSNMFDSIHTYRVMQCLHCSCLELEFIGHKSFKPELYDSSSKYDKDCYRKELEDKGILSELDFNLCGGSTIERS